MFKKIMLTMALMACSSTLFAVQCPSAGDFEKKGGTFWGYYWNFKSGANTEGWKMFYWHFRSNALSTADTFPGDTPLKVVFYNSCVHCLYALKDINSEDLDTYFVKSPKQDSLPIAKNSLLPTSFSTFYRRSSRGPAHIKLGECNTTADNPQACSWEWAV